MSRLCRTRDFRLASSKKEEIAQLEVKLRQLRETEEHEKVASAPAVNAPPNRFEELFRNAQ
jgi:hypothetical protein